VGHFLVLLRVCCILMVLDPTPGKRKHFNMPNMSGLTKGTSALPAAGAEMSPRLLWRQDVEMGQQDHDLGKTR